MIMSRMAVIEVMVHRSVRVRSVGNETYLMQCSSAKQVLLDLWVWVTVHRIQSERRCAELMWRCRA
jgi:hypothetical protein